MENNSYRILNSGEIIRKTDEVNISYTGDTNWKLCKRAHGLKVPANEVGYFRRKVSK